MSAQGLKRAGALPPHVYSIADAAYRAMMKVRKGSKGGREGGREECLYRVRKGGREECCIVAEREGGKEGGREGGKEGGKEGGGLSHRVPLVCPDGARAPCRT
jgi:hypothetical protein